jgi:3-oxoadipate enol-lactonase
MPRIDCGAATLNYELSGRPSNSYLMLSNSLGTDLSMWEPQLAAFEQFFQILRYDMRGQGGSSVPPGPYTIDALAGDVLSLLDALHIERIAFCGMSIGGVIGQWLGANAPERLDRLILCNTAAKIGTVETWNDRIETVRKAGVGSIADAVMTRWFSEAYLQSERAILARLRRVLASTDAEGYVASCEAIRDMNQRELVRAIDLPTLLIAGEYDRVTTVADAELLEGSITGSSLAVLPAAHISNIEASFGFNTVVLRFLQGGFLA